MQEITPNLDILTLVTIATTYLIYLKDLDEVQECTRKQWKSIVYVILSILVIYPEFMLIYARNHTKFRYSDLGYHSNSTHF